MTTLVDAFVVTLGLDPTEFTKSQKNAAEAFAKTKLEAVKSSKEIEDAGKKAADSIKKIATEALALFALFTGARSIKSFVDDLSTADAALGRFGHNLAETPQTIAAWQKAAERAGGSAETTSATISRLSDSLLNLRVNGKALPDAFYQLQAASGMNVDTDHGPAAYMDSIAAALQRLNSVDPAKAAFLANGLGIDSATLSIMERYGAATGKYIDSLKALGPTAAEAKAAQEFQERWVASTQTIQNVFERAFRAIEPGLTSILGKMDAWINANKDLINNQVVEYMGKLGSALQDLGQWIAKPETLQGFREFASEIKDIAKFVTDLADGVKSVVSAAATLSPGKQSSNKARDDVEFNENYKVNSAVDVRKGSIADDFMQWWNGGSETETDQKSKKGLAGARKGGGPVKAGESYLVGEDGIEVFRPDSDGTIIPNGGSGRSVASVGGTGDTTVEGQPVSKANPMPVFLANAQGGGENWLQTLGKWLTGDSTGSEGSGLLGGIQKALTAGGEAAALATAPIGTPSLKGSSADLVDYIRKSATARGIDPDVALRVAKSEGGLSNPYRRADGPAPRSQLPGLGSKENSYGPFQLYISGTGAGLGDRALKAGVDPRTNWKAGIDFALDEVRKKGWGQWYGARSAGITGMRGVRSLPSLDGLAGPLAGANSTANDNRTSSTNTSSSETHIGQVVVQTQATDAHGIASAMDAALKRRALSSSANYGPR